MGEDGWREEGKGREREREPPLRDPATITLPVSAFPTTAIPWSRAIVEGSATATTADEGGRRHCKERRSRRR
jgi:hypothetical protein